MIKLIDIEKVFKKRKVLNKLCFNAEIGDSILIEGANGSGKSTLLKILAGLVEIDAGEFSYSSDEYKVGAFIENPCFLENETLKYNLSFLYNLINNFDEELVSELCKKFELDINDKLKIKNYSIGMRQKASIVQALMENQKIILLDEPTRGLDKKSCQTFSNIMNDLIDSKTKIIIICAHDGVDNVNFSRKLLLENGCLHEQIL